VVSRADVRRRLSAAGEAASRPRILLPALCLIAWGFALWLALDTPHNGWVWYSGGDATEYWNGQWAVAHGLVPQAIISYGLPVLYGWVPLVAGPSLLDGLPVIAVLQVTILVPLGVLGVWAVGDRLFGRRYAAASAALWTFGPLLMMWGFTYRYRAEFEQLFLAPHWAGLTNMADQASLVAVLWAVWAALRAVETGRADHGVVAGVLAGITIALKPANGYLVPAIAVLFLATWRPRTAAAWTAGIVPALLALLVWKAKGLGHVPIVSNAAGATREAASTPLALQTNQYVKFDQHHFSQELRDLREVFWEPRLLEFFVIAGGLGALRRAPAKGLFLLTWFAAFCVVKGSSIHADISAVSYWRFVEPGLPALVLLAAALVFLWPGTTRLRSTEPAETRGVFKRRGLIVPAAAAVIPLVVVLGASAATGFRFARDNDNATEAPIVASLAPALQPATGGVELTWRPRNPPGGTHVSYIVLRTASGNGCDKPPEGADECFIRMTRVAWTRQPAYLDHPGKGTFTYRIAVVADYRDDPASRDLMLLSTPTSLRVG
jgi:hypothetical protein